MLIYFLSLLIITMNYAGAIKGRENRTLWASFVEIQCNFLICNKILLKQIQNVRVVQSLDLETPALRMAHSIRVVLFIFI